MTARQGSGDLGLTSLLSGERVSKTHPRVEACGEIDELTSLLGAVASFLPPEQEPLRAELESLQGDLLAAGAVAGVTPGSGAAARLRPPGDERRALLEGRIAAMDGALPRLQSFILPGGSPAAAWAHVARTVCRRAERRVAALALEEPADAPSALRDQVLPWMNRLSSYLFSLARWCNRMAGVKDTTWKG
jgi:cob(I)alamin adenosyltransferase